jgi:DNA-binding Lrp family transcriptional regulator
MYEIDKIDLKIVNLLIEDGRKSASEIARQIGEVSERAVRYRIERMIEEDVIRLSAVVRPEALGCRFGRMSGWRSSRIVSVRWRRSWRGTRTSPTWPVPSARTTSAFSWWRKIQTRSTAS